MGEHLIWRHEGPQFRKSEVDNSFTASYRGGIVNLKFYRTAIEDNNKTTAALVKPSNHNAKEVLEEKIGFIEYYNNEKKLAHVYDASNNHYIIGHTPFLKDLKYILFFAVPVDDYEINKRPSKNGLQISRAIYSGRIRSTKALQSFPEHVGVVDGVNEDKQLFHCVFGRDVGTIIRYSDTHVRPRPGDVVVARYIVKRDKDNKALIKILDIEIDNSP